MERYLGCDAHSRTCSFAVINGAGKRLRRDVIETNGKALTEFVRQIPGERRLCLEEGEQSQWLVELLSPHVDDVVVVQFGPRPGNKNDERDAFDVAEAVRTGRDVRRVYKDPTRFLRLREASRVYTMLTGDVIRQKNRVKSFYRGRGISCSGTGVYRSSARETWLAKLPQPTQRAVTLVYHQLDNAQELRREAKKALLAESHKHPIARILETAPGLGPIRVAQLLPIVVTPHRFRTSRQFWAYCGLAVVTRSSADWVHSNGEWVRSSIVQTRGLNRHCNMKLKDIFKAAATGMSRRTASAPLRDSYDRLLETGVKPPLARLTIARKIAAIVLAMWKHKEPFDPARCTSRADPS